MQANPIIQAPGSLWQGIRRAGVQTLAVMGMTKNTGKTVCLNHLLAQAHADRIAVGLTSIGRDGEERDQVFFIPKPPVLVTPGCLVATATDTLLRAKTRVKHIDTTGIRSPMGDIVIVKALDAGEMEVAGASRSQDQLTVIRLLKQCGADMVLLDGALGRSQHASPALADGVVLATGAAIGGGIQDVLRKTQDRLAILGVLTAPSHLAKLVKPVFDQGGIGIWDQQGECLFHETIPTINAAPVLQALKLTSVSTLAVSGAVGKLLWQAIQSLLMQHPGLTLVVSDGTKLFIDAIDLKTFERQGGQVLAYRGIRLLGITVNPFSPTGASLDAQALLDQARLVFADFIVTDVMLTKEGPCPASH